VDLTFSTPLGTLKTASSSGHCLLTIAAEKLNPDIYFLHQDAAALMAPNPASSDPVPE